MSPKDKGRKFFQQLQPTFSIDLPKQNTTKLEFLDYLDPAKDLVVRKKAREWVNKNKEISKKNQGSSSQKKWRSSRWEDDDEEGKGRRQIEMKFEDSMTIVDHLQTVGTNAMDPFNVLPSRATVGRKYDHILEFFVKSCPEAIPCSDDKYADKSRNSIIPFSHDNSVLLNAAKDDATFIVWLYAIACIRDGMRGSFDTEEVQWLYNKSLRVLREKVKKEADAGKYSDHLLNSIACITATASFCGMFKTAEMHRDALLTVLALRGDGDILKGLLSAVPWTIKVVRWCEIMVAVQLIEPPRIPYHVKASSIIPPPELVVCEAAQATTFSLSNLPPLSEAFYNIFHLLHLIAFAYARLQNNEKIDIYIIQPLYDVEYALLQILAAQKGPDHKFSEVEVLLTEALQLYFWTGPRMLPAQTRICDLLISRVMRALLPLLLEHAPEVHFDCTHDTAAHLLDNVTDWASRSYDHSTSTNNVIAWSLAMGTIVSSSLRRPEYLWFKEHLALQLKFLGLYKNEEGFMELLRIFPATDGLPWVNLKKLYSEFKI